MQLVIQLQPLLKGVNYENEGSFYLSAVIVAMAIIVVLVSKAANDMDNNMNDVHAAQVKFCTHR